jgi:hypothetical protein
VLLCRCVGGACCGCCLSQDINDDMCLEVSARTRGESEPKGGVVDLLVDRWSLRRSSLPPFSVLFACGGVDMVGNYSVLCITLPFHAFVSPGKFVYGSGFSRTRPPPPKPVCQPYALLQPASTHSDKVPVDLLLSSSSQ